MKNTKPILAEADSLAINNNTPGRIRVRNKKTGEQYYISKQNFDPAIHDKTDKKLAPKAKDDEESTDGGGDDGGTEKKDSGKEPKKSKPVTPISFISVKRQDAIIEKIPETHPNLQSKILDYDVDGILSLYDSAVAKVKAGKTKYSSLAKSLGVRLQALSLAKYTLLSKNIDDENAIAAAKIYRKNAKAINSMLRGKMPDIPSKTVKYMQHIINQLDRHFSSNTSRLNVDCVVYRSATVGAQKLLASTKTWKDKAYVSTSLNPFIGEDFTGENDAFVAPMRNPLFAFKLKNGDSVLITPCSEDPNCNATEITLPRGCQFTIENYDQRLNIYYVKIGFPNAGNF